MTKEELLEKLQFLFDPEVEIGLSMYIIVNTINGHEKRRADITDEVIQELMSQFKEYIRSKFITNHDLIFSDLTIADDRKNSAFFYDLEELPVGLEVMGELIENEELPFFNFNEDNFEEITGFVFLIGNEETKVALYKKQYPISLIKQDSVLMIKKSNHRLVKVDDDIIRLNDSFEFLQIDDEMIVLSLKTLERYFGFDAVIRNQALANVQIIEQANLLEDSEPLEELVEDIRFAKKLMRIKPDSPVLQLPFAHVRAFIQGHPKLRRRLRFNNNSTRISLDTKTSKELFLKLLDDDFLKSELTNLLYESDIKNKMTNEEEED